MTNELIARPAALSMWRVPPINLQGGNMREFLFGFIITLCITMFAVAFLFGSMSKCHAASTTGHATATVVARSNAAKVNTRTLRRLCDASQEGDCTKQPTR